MMAESEMNFRTGCICTCGLIWIAVGCTLIALGVNSNTGKKSSLSFTLNEISHKDCIIQDFDAFICHCHGIKCDLHQEYNQYMYHALSNETCGNQTIKSVKDECEITAEKDTPYESGEEVACYIDDCDGFFIILTEDVIYDAIGQIYVGLGISSLIMAGFCCLAALIDGSNDCCNYSSRDDEYGIDNVQPL